jgi:hypothetical protein
MPTQCTVLAKIIWVLTLLMYLNDDFDGGETSFRSYKSGEEDPIIQSIVPKTGSVLLFTQRQMGPMVTSSKKSCQGAKIRLCRCLEIDLLVINYFINSMAKR